MGQPAWRKVVELLVKGLLAYYSFGFVRKNFLPPPAAQMGSGEHVYGCAWQAGDSFDLFVYVSDAEVLRSFKPEDLVWEQHGLQFGSWTVDQYRHGAALVELGARRAEEMWAHVYVIRRGADPKTDGAALLYQRLRLGGTARDKEGPTGTYWYPELDVSLVNDPAAYDLATLHPMAVRQMTADRNTKLYHPIVYLNEFWHIKERRVRLAGDEASLPLKLSFSPLSLFKLQMLLSFDYSFRVNEALLDAEGGVGGIDSIKESLLNTAPWLLFLTLLVTLLHTLFDLLAFKNDIQFWCRQEDLTGLSVRSITLNAACQLVILLYLLEQNTSAVVLLSTAAGLLIEVWKVFRVASVTWRRGAFGVPVPVLAYRASYRAATRELDERAMLYLSAVALPLLVAYAAWSFARETHRSVYSWFLGSLVGFVYTFGFIMMTPQLFINYKLKSVAHLPWRVFVYKALNTFIDDLFAFIIKMPMLHRIACFRDDLVFLVYLYQRWKYPVDRSRTNEFGQTFADDEKKGELTTKEDEPSAPVLEKTDEPKRRRRAKA